MLTYFITFFPFFRKAGTLISISLYQAVTLDEFPASRRLHLVLSAMGFLFLHALFTIIWVVRRMLKIAKIRAVPSISEATVENGGNGESVLSDQGGNASIRYLDESPERRQSNHSITTSPASRPQKSGPGHLGDAQGRVLIQIHGALTLC